MAEDRNDRGDRDKNIEMAMSQIERQFGTGAIMRMGDEEIRKMDVIPTGALSLDLALGIGGVPRGRIVEIYGPESSGKTSLALHIVAEAQRNGGLAAFIDAEHALDPIYARAIGVDVDELLISQPDTGEQALEITDMLIRSGALDVVVIDSVAALVPRAELEAATLEMARKIAAKSRFALKLTKKAINACQDAQGRELAMDNAFHLHQLAHTHWLKLYDVLLDPTGLPEATQKALGMKVKSGG